jgi:hypothetical protein
MTADGKIAAAVATVDAALDALRDAVIAGGRNAGLDMEGVKIVGAGFDEAWSDLRLLLVDDDAAAGDAAAE